MNRKNITLLAIATTVMLSIAISSCSKYQDGPIISFKAKKKRIANTWEHSAYVYLDQNLSVTTNLPKTTYTYFEDGRYHNSVGDTGKWEFLDEVDLKITITNRPTDSVFVYEILRLSSKSLWLKTNQVEEHYTVYKE